MKITGMRRIEESIRPGDGWGDNWHMTWAKNGSQYVGLCDGGGWEYHPQFNGKELNSRIYIIGGNPPDIEFKYMENYPLLVNEWVTNPLNIVDEIKYGNKKYSRYYGFGIIAIDGYIYHFLSTPKKPFGVCDNAFVGVKLIYSPDDGRTWNNQNGSPICWEDWDDRKGNMLFFEEQGNCFSLLTVLQMGRNYEDNRDGYIYIYSPNGSIDGSMNQLVLARVKKENILVRKEYEFFRSINSDGSANWSSDIHRRGIIYTFQEGWVNWNIGYPNAGHPYSWHPSVVYNKPLGIYIMANWGMGIDHNGNWFAKPSCLGFWTAPTPWGPWTQVYNEIEWLPDGDARARCYQPQISPKWISEDGKSFWLVWTDYRTNDDKGKHYAFNCQKIEILCDTK